MTELKRLEHRLSILTGGACNLPLRQQTLRNTIQWSYDLLSTSSCGVRFWEAFSCSWAALLEHFLLRPA